MEIASGTTFITLPRVPIINDGLNERNESFILVATVLGKAANETCFRQPQNTGLCSKIGATEILIEDNDGRNF